MYEIQIEMQDKWYNLADFDAYEEIEELGEILSVDGLPDGLDLESDFDALKAYDGMDEDDQKIVTAYYKATNVFNPEEAMEAYQGSYYTGADFAQELCEDVEHEALEALPNYLRYCIKWADVWEHYLQHDYFEKDGYYFRNV